VERLLQLMNDRLALMHDVARAKGTTNRPIADPERERVLLTEMEEKGRSCGLDPQVTRAFFEAQIAAARSVQRTAITRWAEAKQGPFEDTPDLAKLRQRIDGINLELLSALGQAQLQLGDAGARKQLKGWARAILTGDGITDDVRAAAIEPLVGP